MIQSQIALPLLQARSNQPEHIVIGASNRRLADALFATQNWPFGTAVLTGPARSGKSLFSRWFASHTGGGAIDDADQRDEAEVFHAWNRAQEDGYPLLLTVSEGDWDIALPDLRSRMGAALRLEIGPLDDDMAGELILSHAVQRGLSLGDGASTYLATRMERSYAAIERIVEEIDRLSLERKVPATMSLWRAALDIAEGHEQGRLL